MRDTEATMLTLSKFWPGSGKFKDQLVSILNGWTFFLTMHAMRGAFDTIKFERAPTEYPKYMKGFVDLARSSVMKWIDDYQSFRTKGFHPYRDGEGFKWVHDRGGDDLLPQIPNEDRNGSFHKIFMQFWNMPTSYGMQTHTITGDWEIKLLTKPFGLASDIKMEY